MHVVGAAARGREHARREHRAVVEREEEVGRDALEALGEGRRVRIVGDRDLEPAGARELFHALEPDRLARVVVVRHHERNAHSMGEQHREAAHAHVVIGEDDRARLHHSGFSSSAWIT